MRPSAPLLALSLLLPAGCSQLSSSSGNPHGDSELLSQVRARLAERSAKIPAFALTQEVTEGTHVSRYEFWYRAPNLMRGDITEPAPFSYAFDGRFFYQQSDERKSLLINEMDPGKEATAVDLLQAFSPFAPEGLRPPFIRKEGAVATRVKHPLAQEAVEVKQTLRIDGMAHKLTYVLRWPSMDLLSRTLSSKDGTVETRVEKERCDEALGLCFPRELSDWHEGRQVSTTLIPDLDLKEELEEGGFKLEAPREFLVQKQFLDGGTLTVKR